VAEIDGQERLPVVRSVGHRIYAYLRVYDDNPGGWGGGCEAIVLPSPAGALLYLLGLRPPQGSSELLEGDVHPARSLMLSELIHQ
jgi:hypothetical protein